MSFEGSDASKNTVMSVLVMSMSTLGTFLTILLCQYNARCQGSGGEERIN